MRSSVKQFESICSDRAELTWDGICCPASSISTKYMLLVEAVQPFVEAAKLIPQGTSPDDTVYALCPPLGLFVGDFYTLVCTLTSIK